MTITLTALQYQQILQGLPNPEKYKGKIPGVCRVSYIPHNINAEITSISTTQKPAKILAEVSEIEFELANDKVLPYWQPTRPITIIPTTW